MYIIGENIHIISPSVKKALAEKDAEFFKKSAIQQVEAGAKAIDLNLGRQKHDWAEVFPWVTKTVQEVVDVPLCIDSTNVDGIEAALKVINKARPIVNSTSAEAERLEQVPLLAKKYDAQLVALTLKKEGIPVAADERVNIALEYLIPRAMEVGIELPDLIIDPLALTVSGCQEFCPELIEAVRTIKFAGDPPPGISVGLSNVSNAVPEETRPILNRVYLAMLMGAGLEMMIADP
ncbi:MAG: dihydropteroate synthase, partial [Anaerolineales bacterium]